MAEQGLTDGQVGGDSDSVREKIGRPDDRRPRIAVAETRGSEDVRIRNDAFVVSGPRPRGHSGSDQNRD